MRNERSEFNAPTRRSSAAASRKRGKAIVCCVLLLVGLTAELTGCSGMERKKYLFWGDVVGVKPDTLLDHWEDYGTFLPNDPNLKKRRGKAGVLRFFLDRDMSHSIPVSGSLIVFVFRGDDEGVELTEPMAKLVLEPEQLDRQRKFDKKKGYNYHIWLDLGEIDLPEENISILCVFTDSKTKEQVASGITYTRITGGSSPGETTEKSTGETSPKKTTLDPETWAQGYRRQKGDTVLLKKSAEESKMAASPETADREEATAPATVNSDGTVIELSSTMVRQLENGPPQTPTDEKSRMEAYLEEKCLPKGWSKAEGMDFQSPVLTAQASPVATLNSATPASTSAGGTTAVKAGGTKIVGPNQKKLTFSELRSAGGPQSEQGAYFSLGTVGQDGSLQNDASLVPKENGAIVLY